MKALIAVLAAALVYVGANSTPSNVETYTISRDDQPRAGVVGHEWTMEERLAFIQNVLYLDVSGTDLSVVTPPTVEVAVYPWWGGWGVAGWYTGGDTIYISKWYVQKYGMDSLEVQEVIIHELTHWVDDRFRGSAYELWGEKWQWSEENAWHVGNVFWVYEGYPENADYRWFDRYGFDSARPVTPWDPRQGE